MSALTYLLAEDSDGAWTIVFEPEDLHLYLEFVKPGMATDPVSGMTIDDFLARRPVNPAHRRALDNLVAWLRRALEWDTPIHPTTGGNNTDAR
ncbi:hypothetical protein NKJ06_22750 [Mesorhizobium sp. M0293]|uniref:hypothetical protein n=1 Tax=Mesorhizobium sp. M0293 TaxID=2956930 RepID=UPI003336A2B7